MQQTATVSRFKGKLRRLFVPAARASLAVSLSILAISGCGGGSGSGASKQSTPYTVTVATSGTSIVQPGDTLQLKVSGLQNPVTAANFNTAFTLSGSATVAAYAQPSSAQDQGNGTYLIGIPVPTTLQPTQPATYTVSVSGNDSKSVSFTSSDSATIKIDPPASIASLTPASARNGQTVSVTIVGNYTGFVDGPTVASFGAGISVGGAASGAAGPVTVSSPTQAVASLIIDPSAAAGVRDVILTTGAQTVTAKAAFTVLPALLPPTIVPGGPYTGLSGNPVSFDGSASTDPNGSALTLTWNFGDHTTAVGAKVQHTYPSAGTYSVTLDGVDTFGATASAITTATITAPILPPVANPGGPYTGTVGQAIAFNGSGSTDPNGFALTYNWNFGDNSTGSGVSPTHTYSAAGKYAVTLVVDNGHGKTNSAATTATVTVPVKPPVAAPGGPYTGVATQPVSFDGSASSDPSGYALTYAWSFGDGESGTGANPTHTYASAGTYNVTLTVDNGHGGTNSASTTATIATFQEPIVSIGGPYTGTVGTAITFSAGKSTDPYGYTLTYAWNFGDKTTGSGVSPSHTYATAGTFTVQLTVTDGHGGTSTASTTATVAAVQQPIANAGGPYAGTVGTAIAFSGSKSSSPQGYALTYAWNFGDSTTGTGVSPTHAYAAAGTYTVQLTVTDGHEGSNTASTTAIVTAAAQPTANPGGPYSGTVGTAIALSGSKSSSPEGYTLTYAWNFGDSSTGSGVSPTHAYAATGTYTIELTVTDGHGGSNTASTTATVTAVQQPKANPGGPYSSTVGSAIAFSGSQSSSPQGYTLAYAWNFGDSTTGAGVSPTHAYTAAGKYTVTLTVTDGHGGSSSASTTATVSAAVTLPVANPGGPYIAIPNQSIQFDGTQSYDPLSTPLTYAWTFGDGATANVAQPTHAYAAAGTYTVQLTVNDGSASASATTQTTVTAVVPITISTPATGALTNQPTIAVSGTVGNSTATVSVNGSAATVSSGNWTATSVALREGVNLITAKATAANGNTGTASASITLDTTPPIVSIVSPAAGAKVFSPQLTVSGLVSDLVAGTINAQNVSVAVNGVPASVVNRSFMATNVLLSPGMNTVTVVVTDKAGNTGQAIVQVNYQAQITQQTILQVSGDGQTGVINSTLTQPLVARLVAANGAPVAGRPVTFSVTRSDGQVEVLPSQGTTVTVLSDANGKASALFQIGSRAGVGINQVVATSPGFTGQAIFSATSTIDVPASIRAVIGEHQRAIVGQNAAKPFQVIVADRMGNPLENVPVTFTVTAGGGNIGGETTVTQSTNSDGKATVIVALGMQEGIDNNLVTADYAGDTGSPVVFHASGLVPGTPAQTTVTGLVLDNTNTPVQGATARLENTNLTTTTDINGHFTLTGVPVGTVTLLVDGSTSSSTITYPSLSFVLQALPGVTNSLDMPIYLPAIDTENAQTVGGDQPVTLTMTGVPGLAFTVQPNSVTFPDGTHVGSLSVSQVKSDMVPMPPVNGVAAPIVWTIQPAGAKFNPPIQVQLPNVNGQAPGTVTEIYQYDHDLEQFVSGGTARVSPDGSVIVSDPGFGIVKAGWGHSLPPLPPNNCTISCNEHNDCTQDYTTPQCTCRHNAINIGGNCNGTAKTQQCMTVGTCDAYGHCTNSKPTTDGASCNDNIYCTNPDMCKGGVCTGTPIKDQDQGNLTVGVDLTSLFTPFQNAANILGPGTVTFQVNQSSSGKLSCCEQKQGAMEQKKNDKYNFRLQVQDDIPVPDLAIPPIPFPGGNIEVGLYLVQGGYAQVGMGVYYDKCDDSVCVALGQGQLSVQVGFSLKLKGGPKGAMVDVGAGLSDASTVSLNTTDCHTMKTSFNLSTIKFSWSVVVPGTKLKFPGSTTDIYNGVMVDGPTYTFN